jgi:hypothetical protein
LTVQYESFAEKMTRKNPPTPLNLDYLPRPRRLPHIDRHRCGNEAETESEPLILSEWEPEPMGAVWMSLRVACGAVQVFLCTALLVVLLCFVVFCDRKLETNHG